MPKFRMTRLNLIVHLLAWLPFLWLAKDYFIDNLTANPYQAAEQRTGDTAIVLILLSLACTPANTLFGFRQAIQLRRPLGVYGFLYAAFHFTIFIGLDYGFDLGLIWLELAKKPYIIAGFSALLLLIPLAATSWKWWQKKLGKTWKTLHKLVYAAGILAVFHLAWVVKGNLSTLSGDIWKPLAAAITLTVLLAVRLKPVRKWAAQLRQSRKKVPAQRIPNPPPIQPTKALAHEVEETQRNHF